jgi:hypothetical protein
MKRRTVLFGLGGAVLAGAAASSAWRYSTGSMADYAAYQRTLRAPMGSGVREMIRYAALAANSHNTQPWLFQVSKDAIDLLPDFSRRTPAVDPDDHHLYVSLGCAAENLLLAGAASGMPGEISPLGPDDTALRLSFLAGKTVQDPLFKAITVRQSTRGLYDGRAVPTGDLKRVEEASRVDGVRLILLTDASKRARLRDLVIAANGRQMADDAFMRELRAWLRFNPKSAIVLGDGLFSAASGNPVLPDPVADLVFASAFTAASENDKYRRQMESSAGFAVFFAEAETPAHWMRVGRACQRFCLAATAAGMKTAFLNQPVEVTAFRSELSALAGEAGRRPDLVIRFGYGPALRYSSRRHLDAVMRGG